MIYEILNEQGDVVNTIDADQEFMSAQFPSGNYREVAPPPPPPPPPPPVYQWYIDIGPFFDRFGAAKMAVLTSTDPGVKALLADINIRKWIDLKHPSVAQGLAYIGSKITAVTPALQQAIMTTPVTAEENLALRKLYF